MGEDKMAKEERATLMTIRNTIDRIGGNLYTTKADLELVVHGKFKTEDDEKEEERQAPTLDALQSQLTVVLGVAHDCQVLVSDLRA